MLMLMFMLLSLLISNDVEIKVLPLRFSFRVLRLFRWMFDISLTTGRKKHDIAFFRHYSPMYNGI